MSVVIQDNTYLRKCDKNFCETYDIHALLKTICRDWFRRFKMNDLDVENKECYGTTKKVYDEELLHEFA